MNQNLYQSYLSILKEELHPAMGCTEPISLAYGAAVARKLLGENPSKIFVKASGSIIKNVKSVIVPNTGHLKGIPAAVVAGVVAGNPDKKLEVISKVSREEISAMKDMLEHSEITVKHIENGHTFYIEIQLFSEESHSCVIIQDSHTNLVYMEQNGTVSRDFTSCCEDTEHTTDRSCLTMKGIWDFSNEVDLKDVSEIIERQISYNMAISEEGLKHPYGANIGKVLLSMGNDRKTKACAYAAAGSDARMNGCELPVVINSGSGNQGIASSVPVIVYARELHVSNETLYRALVLSNLTTIYQKTPIGRLSAYCGAVSAGAGAGAGIAYLHGAAYDDVVHTVVNAISITSGIVCDGAKSSCAAKISASVDAGILGFYMYKQGQQFYSGDGIVSDSIERTVENVGNLAREGMKETNEKIIQMMLQ